MAEKLDINVAHGVGYIKEFNGVINYGSNEKFVPMIEWLKNEIPIKVKSIGKRYAPNLSNCDELNISLSISESFNYFDSRFTYSKILLEIKNIIARKAFVKNDYGSFDKTTAHNINIENIQNILDLKKIIEKLINLLTTDYEHAESMKKVWGDGISPADIHDYDMDISNIINKIKLLEKLVVALDKESMYRLHIKSILLISGEALIGKTHLLCDTALNRLKLNQPTLLFFGHEFSADKSIILNMIYRLRINNCSETEFLEALNKLGMEYNTRTLIVIDAINETENPKIWQKEIIEFCEKIKSYSNLALVLSIRDVEKNKFITNDNEQYIENEIVEIQHRGFEGIEIDAVKIFCNALGVEFPKVPLHTNRLFINPGILFLYIEIIKETTKKIDTSILNPTIIFKAYIDKLNRDFSQKYNVDEDDRIIEESIRLFISLGTKKDYIHFYIPQRIVSSKIKSIHEKALEFLKSEGVLNKLTIDNEVNLYFTYQKFENFFIAEYLLNYFENNKLVVFDLIKGYNGAMTEALFMQIPEKLNKEIFDLNDDSLIQDKYICEQYLVSLVWRKPELISDDTFKYLNLLLPKHDLYENYLDTVLQLSTIPNHPLNIKKLHKRLLEFSLVERDYNWSIYIHNSYSNDGIINRIINWAWNKNINFEINYNSLLLYGMTLGWFLCSSNRELRDKTTKALVNIFTNNIECFLEVLKEFKSVNDLYITERLYAVAYGITLRSNNQNGLKKMAEYIYNEIFDVDSVVEHVMIRDYAKLTVEYINNLIKLDIEINKVKPPYNSILPDILPTDEEIDSYENKNTQIDRIISSMVTESGRSGRFGYGDFGRYTFQSNLRNFELKDLRIQDLSNYAVKMIIDEIIVDIELFSQTESRLKNVSHTRHEHKIERIGKKYQWIALHKILAIVADNFKIKDHSSYDDVLLDYRCMEW
jgi:PHP family Zn ribbon phosphoesterase